ncbi:MAG: ABC transporter permease [Nodosilinea sp.]
MTWWRKLKTNRLAQLGAILLLCLYVVSLGAGFFAPYSPYASQPNGSLLPPTQVYWRDAETGAFFPHVYPTTQGPVDLDTGERKLEVDRSQPSAIRILHREEDGKIHLFGTASPGKLNLLGTDEQARDQFSRLIHGSRISLSVGLIGIAISFPLGMLVGGLAGYFGGAVDAILMRFVEVLMTIPGIYLLVALAAVLPPGLTSTQRFLLIVLITSLIGWAGLARVIRGQVLSIKEQEFVQASRVMGGRPLYIITRHILPQTATYGIIAATLAIPGFILAEAVLSFIGLGIQQPDASWGNMLSLATNSSILVLQPWLVWPPAILIVVTSLAFNLLGDGLRDALDPRTLKQ